MHQYGSGASCNCDKVSDIADTALQLSEELSVVSLQPHLPELEASVAPGFPMESAVVFYFNHPMASSVFAMYIWFDVGFCASTVIFCGAVMLGGTVS